MEEDVTKIIDSSPAAKAALETIFSEAKRLSNTDEESKKFLQELLNFHPDKPKGWGRHTNASYYSAKYADILRPILESMIADKEREHSIFIDKRKFNNISTKTLLAIISQAWLFLIERSESEIECNKWKTLRGEVEVCKDIGGVRFNWKPIITTPIAGEHFQILEPQKDNIDFQNQWKQDLLEFLEKAQDNDRLEIKGLNLKEKHIIWIKELLNGIEGIFIKTLTSYQISVIKNKELWEKYGQSKNTT